MKSILARDVCTYPLEFTIRAIHLNEYEHNHVFFVCAEKFLNPYFIWKYVLCTVCMVATNLKFLEVFIKNNILEQNNIVRDTKAGSARIY